MKIAFNIWVLIGCEKAHQTQPVGLLFKSLIKNQIKMLICWNSSKNKFTLVRFHLMTQLKNPRFQLKQHNSLSLRLEYRPYQQLSFKDRIFTRQRTNWGVRWMNPVKNKRPMKWWWGYWDLIWVSDTCKSQEKRRVDESRYRYPYQQKSKFFGKINKKNWNLLSKQSGLIIQIWASWDLKHN